MFQPAGAIPLPYLPFNQALALDVASALVTHFVYKRYEPNTAHLSVHFTLLLATPGLISTIFVPHFVSSPWKAPASAFLAFYITLLSSIVVYRLSPWHPLAEYPGPILAKTSKFWGAFQLANGKYHLRLKELHDKYGPYVRIGPNELSITDLEVHQDISSIMSKGPAFDAFPAVDGAKGLIAVRSFKEHTRRRKPWSRAFSTLSLKGYEPIIQKRALQLVSSLTNLAVPKETFDSARLSDDVGTVDLAGWLSYFSTDFMGDMAFGGGFEMMRDGGDKEGIWARIRSGLRPISFIQNVPWLMPLILRCVDSDQVKFFDKFAEARVKMRMANGSTSKDLFYHLMDEGDVEKVKPTMGEVISDGTLAIGAGSDTTSTVLAGLFFYLLRNRDFYDRLQKEVDAAFPIDDGEPFDTHKLEQEMPYLNAVINESLRLQPSVPTQSQRAPEAGSGGVWIKNRFFSENTAVILPPYVIHRDVKNFSPAPNTFWPDRWLPSPSLSTLPAEAAADIVSKGPIVTNASALVPFSYGSAGCAGKGLAVMEMRMMAALLMQKFEMRFAFGYDEKSWGRDLEDLTAVCTGQLPVVLASRSKAI